MTLALAKEDGVGWEDQGRQGHGWFGNGTAGGTGVAAGREEAEVSREAVRVAVAGLPRRVRAEFEAFTGRDGGERMLRAMAIWVDGASMVRRCSAACWWAGRCPRRGRGATGDGTGAHQARRSQCRLGGGRASGDRPDQPEPGGVRYGLASALHAANHAAVRSQVPDRPPPAVAPKPSAPHLTITVRPDGTEPPGKALADIPALVAILTTMAVRLGPAAFAEAAALLLAGLPAAVVAGVLLYLILKLREKEGQEGLVPPAVPPQEPGLVPPASPAEKPGEGGFTAVPSPDKPGEGGTTSAPALPNTEVGPAIDPPRMPTTLPMTRPTVSPRERDSFLKKKGLPTRGENRFIHEKNWAPPNDLRRGERHGFIDRRGWEWVKPRGIKQGEEWHWDVQLPNGTHLNVTRDGKIHHGNRKR